MINSFKIFSRLRERKTTTREGTGAEHTTTQTVRTLNSFPIWITIWILIIVGCVWTKIIDVDIDIHAKLKIQKPKIVELLK